jgi:cellulose synthase/poly-beta-1,6-N-acetylglucosamine synthase-like glycosyltransferase
MINVECEAFCVISWSGREALKLPCFLAGTGVFLRKKDLMEMEGWNNSLVDDFELFTRYSLKKKKLHFANNLVVYDEKPATWSSLFSQRTRWIKGHLHVIWEYLGNLGNPIDYIFRLSPLAIFAWWVSSMIYFYYFITGQISIWEPNGLIWVLCTVIFYLLLSLVLWSRRRLKEMLLLPFFWLFMFHWVWVVLLSLKTKSWSQTKTIHFGG